MTGAPGDQKGGGRWSVRKIAVVIYPLAAGAAAVNIFFIGLMIQALGVAAFTPMAAILAGCIAGVPFAWIVARWLRGLVDQAEDEAG